jgi:hypothetical protein
MIHEIGPQYWYGCCANEGEERRGEKAHIAHNDSLCGGALLNHNCALLLGVSLWRVACSVVTRGGCHWAQTLWGISLWWVALWWVALWRVALWRVACDGERE